MNDEANGNSFAGTRKNKNKKDSKAEQGCIYLVSVCNILCSRCSALIMMRYIYI